jgi:hypothetical protein
MATYVAETPERGFTFLANEVRRGETFSRAEVEAALENYQAIAQKAVETGDWSHWADQFTEDAIYVEHQFGVMRRRSTIQAWIVATMAEASGQQFPVQWYMIDNDLVFLYLPIQHPAPDGGAPFQFTCGTILCYAGDGLWCYEEDIYNATEAARTAELYQRSVDGR